MPIIFSETPPQPHYIRRNGVLITTEPLVVEIILGGLTVRLYPTFQSHRYRVRGEVAEIIEMFRTLGLSDKAIMDWFYSSNTMIPGGVAPVDALYASPRDVSLAAKRHATSISPQKP